MKLIGPAAWQAMAMATQQHYLVEISGKLSAMDGKLDELIARDEDVKVSSAHKARALAAAVQTTLSSGGAVTPQRREELGVLLRRIDDDWRELWVRTDRLLKAYQAEGSGQEDALRVDVAWSQLLRATQALAETSTAFAVSRTINPTPPRRCDERRASGSPDVSPISTSWPSTSHRARLRAGDAPAARRQPHQQPGRAGASEGHEKAAALRARPAGRPARGDCSRAGRAVGRHLGRCSSTSAGTARRSSRPSRAVHPTSTALSHRSPAARSPRNMDTATTRPLMAGAETDPTTRRAVAPVRRCAQVGLPLASKSHKHQVLTFCDF
jgi:hypothetical protein